MSVSLYTASADDNTKDSTRVIRWRYNSVEQGRQIDSEIQQEIVHQQEQSGASYRQIMNLAKGFQELPRKFEEVTAGSPCWSENLCSLVELRNKMHMLACWSHEQSAGKMLSMSEWLHTWLCAKLAFDRGKCAPTILLS